MSITNDFAFGVGNPTVDLFVQKAFPALTLGGTEQGGNVDQVVEVGGQLWLVVNAVYNASLAGFQQQNTALPSFALVIATNGTLIYNTASAGASTPITWTSSTLGVQNLGFLIVTNFGADPTGVNDSTRAILNATAAAQAAGVYSVYFPPGSYLVNSTLTITAQILWFGVNNGSGGPTKLVGANIGYDLIYGVGASNVGIKGISIGFNSTTGTGGHALRFQGCQDVQIQFMDIVGCWSGVLIDSSGDVIYNTGNIVFAQVTNGTGISRYGARAAALSAGNANECAFSSVGMNNRGVADPDIDGFVLSHGYNTMTLVNCGGESVHYAVWTNNGGGFPPNFFVASNFTAEGCAAAFQFDDGGVTQIFGGLITTSGASVVIGPNFSTVFDGIPVTISDLYVTSSLGGFSIQGNAVVIINGGTINASVSGTVGLDLLSSSTACRVTCTALQINGVSTCIHVGPSWQGQASLSAIIGSFANIGLLWDVGCGGTFNMVGGSISNCETNTFIDAAGTDGLPANVHPNYSVVGVSGVNPRGPFGAAAPANPPVSGTQYNNFTGFAQTLVLTNTAGIGSGGITQGILVDGNAIWGAGVPPGLITIPLPPNSSYIVNWLTTAPNALFVPG